MFRVYPLILIMTICVCAQSQTQVSEFNLLQQFIDHVSKKTNKTIVYDHSVISKKLYIANLKTSSNEELLNVFHSVLEYNGYIVEKVGVGNSEVLKLKRNIQGPWTSTPIIYSKEELEAVANNDQFITMVIDLKHISSREVQTTLRSLRIVNPQGGNLAGIEGSNTLLITDYAPNVKRIYDVVERMDRKKNVDVISDKFAIEGKSIPVTLDEKEQCHLSIELSANVSVTIKDENDNVLVSGNGSDSKLWLNYYMSNSVSKKLLVELSVFREDITNIEMKIDHGKNPDQTIWSFNILRALAKGKKIKFTLSLLSK